MTMMSISYINKQYLDPKMRDPQWSPYESAVDTSALATFNDERSNCCGFVAA
jgi:hypothetical protein